MYIAIVYCTLGSTDSHATIEDSKIVIYGVMETPILGLGQDIPKANHSVLTRKYWLEMDIALLLSITLCAAIFP